MAWQYEQQLTCDGCGLPRDETTDRTRQFAYRARSKRCHACRAIDQASTEFHKRPHIPGGVLWGVELDESAVIVEDPPHDQ